MTMIVIPKEVMEREKRLAATPDTVQKIKKKGFNVAIEDQAGQDAGFSNDDYIKAGADIWSKQDIWGKGDLLFKINPPTLDEVAMLKEGGELISFIWPASNQDLLNALAEKKATVLAMDCVPRISRAQKLDALSSTSNITGYRAVLEAAYNFGSFLGMQSTAAGKIKPATVFVIGAGVAGLAAIGAARAMGAQVKAYDVRSAARDQVESMGAEFVEVNMNEAGEGQGGYAKEMTPAFYEAQRVLFEALAPELDIVITTALIPGRPAPKLWTEKAVRSMKAGSIVVDLAAERGGNCALTVPNEMVIENGVKIIGWTDLASRLAPTASQLYGMNLVHFLDEIKSKETEGIVEYNLKDVIVRSSIVLHQGQITWPPPPLSELDPNSQPKEMKATDAAAVKPAQTEVKVEVPAPVQAPVQSKTETKSKPKSGHGHGKKEVVASPPLFSIAGFDVSRKILTCFVLSILWLLMLIQADQSAISVPAKNFLNHLTVFALSCFIGWQVIWNVTPALHTPLMSVTNAISGIILVGGILQATGDTISSASILGAIATALAMINIVGGFAVSQRMLEMFKKD
jgi:NAD(P) transhydrogenase subunit alpha